MRDLTASTDTGALCARLRAAHPRRAVVVQRLHDVCTVMARTPGAVFTVAAVAAACANARYPGDVPGPAEGTIRNPEGEPYRKLIAAFATRNPVSKRSRAVDPNDAELARAPPVVRQRVRQLERAVASLSAENRVLREHAVRSACAVRPAAATVEPALSPEGLEGLRDWLSPDHRASLGWRVDAGGRLLDARGTTLMASEAYRTLREMLAHCRSGNGASP
ncbi:hypothetical protein DFR29_103306 [Tahibacter aquaticus]|uniref:Uncharacterized protein n=1 Tax=Tahibacter aquaticus TaxID=520092 RepID=A0A4R6Z508_9GAMM|nr:gamma-mobile-trio protein GmtX [Tahibacter aquaticus]TDR46770.1 hypothetical protein DFR29_103306 [Tahibacter aquaticus]